MGERTFDNFVVTPQNLLAHAAALSAAEQPGRRHNPLVLLGPEGVGKSHLLEAIADHLASYRPELRVHRDLVPYEVGGDAYLIDDLDARVGDTQGILIGSQIAMRARRRCQVVVAARRVTPAMNDVRMMCRSLPHVLVIRVRGEAILTTAC